MGFKPEEAHELLQLVSWSYSLSKERKEFMEKSVNGRLVYGGKDYHVFPYAE